MSRRIIHINMHTANLTRNMSGCKFSTDVTTPCNQSIKYSAVLALYGDNTVKCFGYMCGSLTSAHARPSLSVTESFEDL